MELSFWQKIKYIFGEEPTKENLNVHSGIQHGIHFDAANGYTLTAEYHQPYGAYLVFSNRKPNEQGYVRQFVDGTFIDVCYFMLSKMEQYGY